MKNKIIMIVLSALLAISLSGCDDKTNNNVSGGVEGSDKQIETEVGDETKDTKDIEEEQKEQEEPQEEKNEKITKTIKVYFSDDQAENLIEKEIDIDLSEGDSLEEKIIESLKAKPHDPKMFNAVDENIKINRVKVEDKLATVDISGENLNGGSTQEQFLVDAVVSALTSLDTIDSVQFIVDGEKVESLMGHVEVTKPFTKDDVGSNIIK